jgi:hypothetical protein
LFLDFRRLRASDSEAGSAEKDGASGTKRKAQTSQVRNEKLSEDKYCIIDRIISR